MSTIVSMNYLLEAGVHFGHQRRRWNRNRGIDTDSGNLDRTGSYL